jgi:poly(A) polymerase Pap1
MNQNFEATIDEILAFFFKVFAKWDWSAPVSLNDNQKECKQSLITILTPTEEPLNSSETIIQSQYNIIINELSRAHKIMLKFQKGKILEYAELLNQKYKIDGFSHLIKIKIIANDPY